MLDVGPFDLREPLLQLGQRHGAKGLDALAVHQDILRLLAQMQTMTNGTSGATFVPRQNHFVQQLVVLLTLQLVEERIESAEVFVTRPDQMFLFRREGIIRGMNREIKLSGVVHQLFPPSLHLLALPAGDRLIVDRFGLIGYHQILIDTRHDTDTLAFGACAYGIVEVKEVLAGFDEPDTVRFEAFGEDLGVRYIIPLHIDLAFAVPFEESRLHAVGKAVGSSGFMIDDDTIYKQISLVTFYLLPGIGIQTYCVAVNEQATETLAEP